MTNKLDARGALLPNRALDAAGIRCHSIPLPAFCASRLQSAPRFPVSYTTDYRSRIVQMDYAT